MKEEDVMKDLLQTLISIQTYYNDKAIFVRNPEARFLFTQMRDDKMRHIAAVQQKVERLITKPSIISRILPAKTRV